MLSKRPSFTATAVLTLALGNVATALPGEVQGPVTSLASLDNFPRFAGIGATDSQVIVKARSRVVTIIDGLHVKKDYWYIMPERTLDVYHVEIPLQPHTVTFKTDIDSISFAVTHGSRHEFVIRLDDGAEARTQVRAAFRSLRPYRRTGPVSADGADIIPFTLGDNDKIYVKGRLNRGPVLDFQFDLGAGGSIIKKASVPKTRMRLDGTVTLRNSDGDNLVPASSVNHLEIAGLSWDSVGFAVADNMTRREDGLIGNALFRDKVLEIDYDRMVIAIHDTLPALSSEWIKQDMILDGVVPYVRGTLSVDDSLRDGWLLLDTGAYTSILNSDRLSPPSKIVGELRRLLGPLGDSIVGPGCRLAVGRSPRPTTAPAATTATQRRWDCWATTS